MWIKTDDAQYVQREDGNIFHIAEIRECVDAFIVCHGHIDLSDWMTKTGEWDADCKTIIRSFYGSCSEFMESYPERQSQEQLIAEMIFESTASNEFQTEHYVNEADAVIALEQFVKRSEKDGRY